MAGPRWSIAELNALDRDGFVERLDFLFEGSPWITATAWDARPFADRADLHAKACAVVRNATTAQQLSLIRSHPDLVGRAALAGTLTRESTGEQRAAGLDPGQLSAADIAAFTEGNEAYKARFGFPFVICARENKKEGILAGFRTRLHNDEATEIATALGEIEKIAHYRLLDVIEDVEPGTNGGAA